MNYNVYLSTKVNPSKLNDGSGIIVLEPDDYSESQIKFIKKKGYKVLAYLSVGTIEKERSWFKKYSKYKLSRLDDWPNEYYIDVREEKWQLFIIDRAKTLKSKGFDGWWLDNIDIYSEYKSKTMYEAVSLILYAIKSLNGYVMINGGSEWVDDAIDKGARLKGYIDGYTQEEVFSLIKDYDGKGKFGKQKADDSKYYRGLIKKVIKRKVGGFLLEYTRDKVLKAKIKAWCKRNKVSYYISEDVNL